MNIAIVDDIRNEIDNLKKLLSEYAATIGTTFSFSEFSSGEDFLDNYHAFKYTIIFLDIYMTGITGIKVAEKIRETDKEAIIVFSTTSVEHMADAFSIHAFDYVVKPAKKDKIFRMMDDILQKHTSFYSEKLKFSVNRQDYMIPYSEIVSIETSKRNYLEISNSRGELFKPRMTFSYILELLRNENNFLQINRNIIVNMDYISSMDDGMCKMEGNLSFPIYTKKIKETEQIWRNYMFRKVRKESQGRGIHL